MICRCMAGDVVSPPLRAVSAFGGEVDRIGIAFWRLDFHLKLERSIRRGFISSLDVVYFFRLGKSVLPHYGRVFPIIPVHYCKFSGAISRTGAQNPPAVVVFACLRHLKRLAWLQSRKEHSGGYVAISRLVHASSSGCTLCVVAIRRQERHQVHGRGREIRGIVTECGGQGAEVDYSFAGHIFDSESASRVGEEDDYCCSKRAEA
mmetsp:Transcript_13853/g.23405  ORF Transcript_13853/g.23405 Transcript_13853/m.23405 type:complete len:205 (+) Transcript_13853:808-1422(+)